MAGMLPVQFELLTELELERVGHPAGGTIARGGEFGWCREAKVQHLGPCHESLELRSTCKTV